MIYGCAYWPVDVERGIADAPVMVLLDIRMDRETLERMVRMVTEDLDMVLEQFERTKSAVGNPSVGRLILAPANPDEQASQSHEPRYVGVRK